MSIDLASFLHHTPESEKTTVYVHVDEDEIAAYDALLVAQTRFRKLYITLEPKRRYLAHTQIAGEEEPEIDRERERPELAAACSAAEVQDISEALQNSSHRQSLHRDQIASICLRLI